MTTGIKIRNDSQVDLMAVLSQLTPLHWNAEPIKPGETTHLTSGKVWFTVSVSAFDKRALPSEIGVAGRLSVIVGATVISGVVLAPVTLAVVGGVSGATSNAPRRARKTLPWQVGDAYKLQGCRRGGQYADGRTLVVRGVEHPDGLYQLYIARIEWTDPKTGLVTKSKDLRTPRLRTKGAPLLLSETHCALFEEQNDADDLVDKDTKKTPLLQPSTDLTSDKKDTLAPNSASCALH